MLGELGDVVMGKVWRVVRVAAVSLTLLLFRVCSCLKEGTAAALSHTGRIYPLHRKGGGVLSLVLKSLLSCTMHSHNLHTVYATRPGPLAYIYYCTGFQPFDLEAWWGQKLYHALTSGV